MYLKKIILKNISKNINLYNFHENLKNKDIYKYINILATLFKKNLYNSISFSNELSIKYKFLIIIFSIVFNYDLFLFKNEKENSLYIKNDNHLTNLLQKYAKTIDFSIIKKKINSTSNIHFKINNKINIAKITKILEFFKSFKNIFGKIILNKKYFMINNLNSIYFIYFLPLIIHFKLIYKDCPESINITDKINDKFKFNLFIGNKFITHYPKNNTYSIFFSYTLCQFLLYNVVIDDYKIIGALFNFFKIKKIDNESYIIYNEKLIKFPKSYNLITNKILSINKKISKLIIDENETKIETDTVLKTNLKTNYFYKKFEFSKLIYLNSNILLNNNESYKLYKSILESYPELINKNENYYFYNQHTIVKYTPFSMYFFNIDNKAKIIIQLSKEYVRLEKNIMNTIEENIYKISIFENIIIKRVYLNKNKYKNKNIKILSEIEFLFIIIYNIIPCYLKYLFNIQKKCINNNICLRNQFIYKFNENELDLLKRKSKKINLHYRELFKTILIYSINNLYKNLLILYSNNNGNYIYPSNNNVNYIYPSSYKGDLNNIQTKLKKYEASCIGQKFIKHIIFSYLKKLNYNNFNSELFVFIDEIFIENKKTHIKFEKSTSKFLLSSVPIQITYYISDNSLNFTISSIQNYKNIKYIIHEILNILKLI